MAEPARGETYAYPRFKMSNYELGYFPGPKAGEEVDYDYTLTDLDGKEVSLADYKGKWLVIESGSLTCPMYVKNVKPYAKLKEKYPDVEWLVVYVREAHPGEKAKQAETIEEKIAYAKRNRDDYNEERKIIVDDVAGKWHHDWGLSAQHGLCDQPGGQGDLPGRLVLCAHSSRGLWRTATPSTRTSMSRSWALHPSSRSR